MYLNCNAIIVNFKPFGLTVTLDVFKFCRSVQHCLVSHD